MRDLTLATTTRSASFPTDVNNVLTWFGLFHTLHFFLIPFVSELMDECTIGRLIERWNLETYKPLSIFAPVSGAPDNQKTRVFGTGR
jgi:hypothetical protein